MKLYFYGVQAQRRPNAENKPEYELAFVCREAEARETAKLYLPTQEREFPCCLTRLPKDRADTGEISDNWLILTTPDEETARAVWRRYFEKNAESLTRRAEECRKQAEEWRKMAASL